MNSFPQGFLTAVGVLGALAVAGLVIALVGQKFWGKIDERRRIIFLAIPLAAFGLFVVTKGRADVKPHDNAWVEQMYPDHVGAYTTIQKIPMDETALRELDPMGYAWRVMSDGRHAIDVMVLTSHERNSFHTPLDCFPAQDFKISEQQIVPVHTKTRGDVPMSVARAEKQGQVSYVAFTYEGPTGMHGANEGAAGFKQLRGDLFFSELRTGRPQFGTFFRFVSPAAMSREDLFKFAAEYLDACPVRPIKG